jgi:hypothetical protein
MTQESDSEKATKATDAVQGLRNKKLQADRDRYVFLPGKSRITNEDLPEGTVTFLTNIRTRRDTSNRRTGVSFAEVHSLPDGTYQIDVTSHGELVEHRTRFFLATDDLEGRPDNIAQFSASVSPTGGELKYIGEDGTLETAPMSSDGITTLKTMVVNGDLVRLPQIK